ncbi:transglutaminase-like cysteine peptidase [Devosia sp. RR2S18]|uniref:transglutaminase-like cysteine peptidase n=1 Tax=Devosia rhizosphaerae TaxID=3049774 RepID=UPI002541E9D1|nr:transglutaminase-like cysteine peptidase [Devosia sp. RR2S18]WIJ23923.1 transglutaminase-like cysteine peptidase [Devosia sp. RR2S18]
MNTKFASVLTGCALALVITSTGTAVAYAPSNVGLPMRTDMHIAALTPFAMQVFCAKNRNQCTGGSGEAGQVRMTQDVLAVLQQVNIHVNATIKPRNDVRDSWQVNPQYGDCEDYVLTKRAQLIRQGLPSGALRIAYTHTRGGQAHAVLVVKTTKGDYVLDNLTNSIKSLAASGYRIRTMSSPNPTRWVAG